MGKKILLSDVVISADAADRLFLEGWAFDFQFTKERYVFTHHLFVNPVTGQIFERPNKDAEPVVIGLEMNQSFCARAMFFGWAYPGGTKIDERSELGRKLSTYLLMTLDRIGYLSFERDVEKRTLSDYPMAHEYVRERCENFYHVATPDDVPIYVMPKGLWTTFKFDKGADAITAWTENFVAVPDVKWKSRKFEEGIIVHEMMHLVQRRKGWLVSPAELGLDLYDVGKLSQGIITGKPLELVAAEVGKDVNLIRRAKGILDQKIEYATRYYELPCEVHAFAEEYRFLATLVPDQDKILAAVYDHVIKKGGRLNSRDKANISGMVYEADRKIEESVARQEDMSRDDTVPETSGDEATATSADQPSG